MPDRASPPVGLGHSGGLPLRALIDALPARSVYSVEIPSAEPGEPDRGARQIIPATRALFAADATPDQPQPEELQ